MQSSISTYETTYILRSDIGESTKKTFLEKLQGIVKNHQGSVQGVEEWGRRKLAYPISNEHRGFYIYLNYSGNNSLVQELERNLRLNEQVLRFLTIKLEDQKSASESGYKPTVNAKQPALV